MSKRSRGLKVVKIHSGSGRMPGTILVEGKLFILRKFSKISSSSSTFYPGIRWGIYKNGVVALSLLSIFCGHS